MTGEVRADQREEDDERQEHHADGALWRAREPEPAHRAAVLSFGTSRSTSRSASRLSATTASAISKAIDWTARTSRIATESTSSLPRPGYANRYSTTITPPIRYCRF